MKKSTLIGTEREQERAFFITCKAALPVLRKTAMYKLYLHFRNLAHNLEQKFQKQHYDKTLPDAVVRGS